MGCQGNHRPVTRNARWGRPQGEKRGWPRGEPVSILFVTSWLRLFSRAEHFLPQATAPARAAVWFLPAAAPLAATEHWRCGPTGPRKWPLRSPLLTDQNCANVVNRRPLPVETGAQKLLTH